MGPTLGGALAEPCLSYPSIFPRGTIFDRYPYLLPNLICTVILICGVAIGILFLEETHELKKNRRDIGLEVGDWILRQVRGSKASGYEKLSQMDELTSLASDDDQPPDYRSSEETLSSASSILRVSRGDSRDLDEERNVVTKKLAFGDAFTRQVVLNIVGYGILA